ncbi:MAG: 4a-hydroxytetrahydrobiopterin dehydratase [Phycisphaerales bacterium]
MSKPTTPAVGKKAKAAAREAAGPVKFTPEEIQKSLEGVPEWSEAGGGIQRTYAFKDFVASIKFVNSVAEAAEAAQHHPDILIRWNKVTLTLTTHDAGGISAKDFELARRADELARVLPE